MDQIPKLLKQARKAKGLTQAALGAKMGLPQSYIAKIEAGKVDLQISKLQEIARLLDLDPMLIPRPLIPAIRSIISGRGKAQKPAWQPDTPSDNEEEELT